MLVISDCMWTVQHVSSVLTEGPVTWNWWKLLFLKSESGSKSSRWKLQQICILWTSKPVDETYATEQQTKPLKKYFLQFSSRKNRTSHWTACSGCFFFAFVELNQSKENTTNCTYIVVCLLPYPTTKTAIGGKKSERCNKLARCNNFFFPFCIRYFCLKYPIVKANLNFSHIMR